MNIYSQVFLRPQKFILLIFEKFLFCFQFLFYFYTIF